MDFNTTIDIILKDLKDIRQILEDLRNYSEIPRLQVELARAKCKSAEEVISLLKTLNPPGEEKSKDAAAPAPEPGKQPEKLIEITAEPEPGAEIISAAGPATDEVPEAGRKPESGIIADLFQGKSSSLVDQFGSMKKDDDLSARLRARPVQSLNEAIGINDRFLFVREIFGGNLSSYEKAMSRLDTSADMAEARSIISEYSNLGEDNEIMRMLLDILKRKLP
jgi:hypothetical protein